MLTGVVISLPDSGRVVGADIRLAPTVGAQAWPNGYFYLIKMPRDSFRITVSALGYQQLVAVGQMPTVGARGTLYLLKDPCFPVH
jgi:hypothetical protein